MARLILHGIPVSPGISIGKAFFPWHRHISTLPRGIVAPGAASSEAERLADAAKEVQRDLASARERVPEELKDHAAIIDSHLLIAADPKLLADARRRIIEQNITAEWALEQAVEAVALAFSNVDDAYIRERVQDVWMVAERIQKRLMGATHRSELPVQERMVLMAHDLSPADTIGLPLDKIMSFAISEGGKTGHTGILARSMLIPAVVGVTNLEQSVNNGDLVIVDALRGVVIVDPDEDELADYTDLKFQFEAYQKAVHRECRLPAETEDGYRMEVEANIKTAEEVSQVLDSGGEGVGLYRTEYTYLSSPALPTEEQLYEEYAELASIMAPAKVTFRTLDVGADKMLSEQNAMEETNPALGLRGIRYCLHNIQLFKVQIRAILRAGVHGNVSLMLPMISGLQELRQAKQIINEVRMELDRVRLPYDRNMSVGIMIELPSAVLTADSLTQEVDFFSIGTNDLIQYSLGIDRGNKHVSYLYQPLHPAIVRSIKFVVDAAHRAGIAVSVCGEVASDPYCIPILLGMQIDAISLSPQAIPGIKRIIRSTNMEECKILLNEVLRTTTVARANRIVRDTIFKQFPEEVTFYASLIESDR